MSLSTFNTKWYKSKQDEGWIIDGNGEPFLFRSDLLRKQYKLRDKTFLDDFKTLLGSSPDIVQYLNQIAVGAIDVETVISLNFDAGWWGHPWEAILQIVHEKIIGISYQQRLSNISVVRTSEESLQYTPVRFDEPLRILIIMGDDGRDVNQYIGLKESSKAIIDSWEGLTASAKQCVLKPVAVYATSTNLAGLIKEHRPHLLWYNGHGRGMANPGIYLADKVWCSPQQLSESIKESGHQVLFCIFWACDTATAEVTDLVADNFPAFYKSLLVNNILSLVGMQSPIRVGNARILALETFSHLANNYSFEVAVSKARYHLFSQLYKDRNLPGKATMDWASPVIWCTSEPRENYEWNVNIQSDARKQWSIVEMVRILSRDLGAENIVGHEFLSHVNIDYSQHEKNLWIEGDIGDKQNLLSLGISILYEISVHRAPILVINFGGIGRERLPGGMFSMDGMLKEWSKYIINSAIPGNLDLEMLQILKNIREYPMWGFSELVKIQGIKIVLLDVSPPSNEKSTDDWFWKLIDEQKGKVIVISSKKPSQPNLQYWQVDNLKIMNSADDEVQLAIDSEPMLCYVLAVLDAPVNTYYLNQLKIVTEVEKWPFLRTLCFQMETGKKLIYSSAKKYILGKMTPDRQKEAHKICYQLTQMNGVEDENGFEKLFFHSHHAGLGEQYTFADKLILHYGSQNRHIPVLTLQRELGYNASQNLTEDSKLTIVWALIVGGRIREAQLLLIRITPKNVLNQAYKYSLLAEIEKAMGKIDKCLQSLNDGITLIEKELSESIDVKEKQAIQVRLLNLKADKVRAQHYLFYDYENAINLYTQLLVEYERDIAENRLQIAVVKRNLAECLRMRYNEVRDNQLLSQSEMELETAEGIAREIGNKSLLPEILYEKAKLLQFIGEEYKEVLDNCIIISRTEHLMLFAIARNKFFWDFVLPSTVTGTGFIAWFKNSDIKDVQNDLAYFLSHGWAKRTLIASKIKSARLFADYEESKEAALGELIQARNVVLTMPVLQGGRSDKENIATIWAGINMLGNDHREWEDFKDRFEWAKAWINEKPDQRTPTILWELNNE